jgi:hypothetical protein
LGHRRSAARPSGHAVVVAVEAPGSAFAADARTFGICTFDARAFGVGTFDYRTFGIHALVVRICGLRRRSRRLAARHLSHIALLERAACCGSPVIGFSRKRAQRRQLVGFSRNSAGAIATAQCFSAGHAHQSVARQLA